MTRYLLDTNIVADLLREPRGTLAARIAQVGEEQICTSIIVASELRYGAAKRGSARLQTVLEGVLSRLPVLPLQRPADDVYGGVRSNLEKSGQQIGANDLLIAAHALALGCILVTDNERELSRVPGLSIENWRR